MKHLFVLLSLTGCAAATTTPPTASELGMSDCKVTSVDKLLVCDEIKGLGGESFPFVWHNKLMYLGSPRTAEMTSPSFILPGYEAVNYGPANIVFVSGLVDNDTLYVFGTNGAQGFVQDTLYVTSTTDLKNWTEPQAVLTSEPTEPFFNSSVAKDAQGYVMAIETHNPVSGYFEWRVSRATSLQGPWSKPGPTYKQGYSACPTIRYSNGVYYVLYLEVLNEGKANESYVTSVTKSTDLVTWTNASKHLFVSDSTQGTSMSDVDLVEYQGRLEMIVQASDQKTWGTELRAVYQGTFEQLMQEMYK